MVEVVVVGGGGCAVDAEAASVVEDEDRVLKVAVWGEGGRAVEADGEAGFGIDGDVVGVDAGDWVGRRVDQFERLETLDAAAAIRTH